MGLLTTIRHFLKKSNNPQHDAREKFILYRLVDSKPDNNCYRLQYLNTRVTFSSTLTELVFDKQLISRLFPEQACFIGIQYAEYLNSHKLALQRKLRLRTSEYLTCRYGKYKICYQDRINNICFICTQTKEEYLLDPRDIALSKTLITEFDALQAFYIGFLAGLKTYSRRKQQGIENSIKRPSYLSIVK